MFFHSVVPPLLTTSVSVLSLFTKRSPSCRYYYLIFMYACVSTHQRVIPRYIRYRPAGMLYQIQTRRYVISDTNTPVCYFRYRHTGML